MATTETVSRIADLENNLGQALLGKSETIRQVAIVLQPFMPDAAAAILDQLAVAGDARSFEHLGEGAAIPAGAELPKPSPVFPRFVEDETDTANP